MNISKYRNHVEMGMDGYLYTYMIIYAHVITCHKNQQDKDSVGEPSQDLVMRSIISDLKIERHRRRCSKCQRHMVIYPLVVICSLQCKINMFTLLVLSRE